MKFFHALASSALAAAALAGVATPDLAFAAGPGNLGTLMPPTSVNYGDTFASASGTIFDDHFDFTLSPAGTVDTIVASIDLANFLGLSGLKARLYAGTDVAYNVVPTGGAIDVWSTPITAAPGITGSTLVIPATSLGAGNYVIEIYGVVSGSAGGSYAGVLNVAPVPEPASALLMLAGLGLAGALVRARSARPAA